jgi:hypothetical protein
MERDVSFCFLVDIVCILCFDENIIKEYYDMTCQFCINKPVNYLFLILFDVCRHYRRLST